MYLLSKASAGGRWYNKYSRFEQLGFLTKDWGAGMKKKLYLERGWLHTIWEAELSITPSDMSFLLSDWTVQSRPTHFCCEILVAHVWLVLRLDSCRTPRFVRRRGSMQALCKARIWCTRIDAGVQATSRIHNLGVSTSMCSDLRRWEATRFETCSWIMHTPSHMRWGQGIMSILKTRERSWNKWFARIRNRSGSWTGAVLSMTKDRQVGVANWYSQALWECQSSRWIYRWHRNWRDRHCVGCKCSYQLGAASQKMWKEARGL